MIRARWLVAVAALAAPVAAVVPAGAQSAGGGDRGPSLTLDRTAVAPGDRVGVQLSGFQDQVVVLAVCGNEAARGAGDCNMAESISVGVDSAKRVSAAQLVIARPPVPCPCVVRAANTGQDQVGLARIELAGVPVSTVTRPGTNDLIKVSVDAHRVTGGLLDSLRSSLGGPTSFDVEVMIENVAGEPVPALNIAGTAGRFADEVVRSFTVSGPPTLAPGDHWTGIARVRVPAPVLRQVNWRVTVAGAGATVRAETRTQMVPIALVLVTGALAGDLLAMRLRRRRRRLACIRGFSPARVSP